MTACEQQPTTKCSPMTGVKSRLGSAPTNKSALQRPDLVGKQFGMVVVTHPEVVWVAQGDQSKGLTRYRHLQVRCTGCGTEKLIAMDNLLKGKTKGCQACSQPRRIPKWLDRRLTAAKARCENPKDPGYENYGGRGVRFTFSSVLEAGLHLMAVGPVDRKLELDRIENSGDYAPGNIHMTQRRANQQNRRITALVEIQGMLIPANDAFHVFRHLHPKVRYSDHTLNRMLSGSMTERDILERWELPSCKPKGVYGTCSTADPEIVSRYLES